METNGIQISSQLVITFIALLLFGAIYNHGIKQFPWLAHRRPAEQVAFGSLVTVLASGFVIGWVNVLLVLVCFVASGIPMIIGSWVRAARDDEEIKKFIKEQIK